MARSLLRHQFLWTHPDSDPVLFGYDADDIEHEDPDDLPAKSDEDPVRYHPEDQIGDL